MNAACIHALWMRTHLPAESNVTTPESNFAQPVLAMNACKHCLTVSSSNMRARVVPPPSVHLKLKVYAQRH